MIYIKILGSQDESASHMEIGIAIITDIEFGIIYKANLQDLSSFCVALQQILKKLCEWRLSSSKVVIFYSTSAHSHLYVMTILELKYNLQLLTFPFPFRDNKLFWLT